jgi:hypothetical protein
MGETKYSLVVKRDGKTNELTAEVFPGDIPRDEFTRVKDGLSEARAREMQAVLLADFERKGEMWARYESGALALPTRYEQAATKPDLALSCRDNKAGDTVLENTPYKDIANKTYVKLTVDNAEKLAAKLQEAGLRFSAVLRQNESATVTVSAADIAKEQQPTDKDEL